MDFDLNGFITNTANAVGTVKDAFDKDERRDLAAAEAASRWDWKPIVFALGGVVAVVVILKLVFKK